MLVALLFFIYTALATPINNTYEVNNQNEYRLPGTQIPSHYKLHITATQEIFDNTINTFDGEVEITFKVTNKSNTIKLHAPMKVKTVELKSENKIIQVTDFSDLNINSSIRTIKLESELNTDINYIIRMTYTADIDLKTMYGFYKSVYNNAEGQTEYLLTTQFEPVSARQAFPCFDEPGYKALFDISITYPKGYNALSNTPRIGNPEDVGFGLEKVIFKQTPKLSTYLVAFVVSKFSCTEGEKIDGTVPHQICSRQESVHTRQLAVEYGKKIIEALENFTGIPYSTGMSKLDQIAIPDFGEGAMENWGLVTYRERLLLYSPEIASNYYKQSIVTIIAHELTHQWFGDLVTPNWWNEVFLNEGFANYFQYFLPARLPELGTWELDKQFVVDQQQIVMVDDAALSSKGITADASTPDEIHAKFNTIAYNKGGSVIKMMEGILGSINFQKGLQNYLKKKSFSNSASTDLLESLGKQASNLPNGLSFDGVMENWLNKPGYPVVSVSQKGKNLILEQERFTYDQTNKSYIWNIPITYTLESDSNKFENKSPRVWLTKNRAVIQNVFKHQCNNWIILNNQENAFYRVHYSPDLWKRISVQLLKNHTEIHVLNRAQIVDDAFNLARTIRKFKYSKAFTYLTYLSKETDYYPWLSAYNSLNFLMVRVGENSSLGSSIKSKILDWLEVVYQTIFFDIDDSEQQIYSLKRELILNIACRYGHQGCIRNISALFKTYKESSNIHKNLRRVVFCFGLKYSDNQEEDWDFLWDKYQNTKLSTEQVSLLGALGCSNSSNSLRKYLEATIDEKSNIRYQDLIAAWKSVYSNSALGAQVALDYLITNHEKIRKYTSDAPSLLGGIASQHISPEQIAQIKNFISSNDVHESYKEMGKAAIELATKNLKWLEDVRKDLEDYFSI